MTDSTSKKIQKTDEEWKEILSEDEYNVLRKKATEAPFSGKYNYDTEKGIYTCGACGNELFTSETKFDAGCGWPSFYDAAHKESIDTTEDDNYGMQRTEVICKKCGSHLGHVFNDGPRPTGLRYCINSLALKKKA